MGVYGYLYPAIVSTFIGLLIIGAAILVGRASRHGEPFAREIETFWIFTGATFVVLALGGLVWLRAGY